MTSGQLIEGFDQAHSITIPIKGIGALSTTQLGMFEILDALDHLKAIEVKRYVHSQEIIQRVEQGSIEELAVSGKLNLETTLASGIDLLMGVGYPNSQNDDFQTLQQAGLPVLLNADWQEKTLLGRAEWMKLLAIFGIAIGSIGLPVFGMIGSIGVAFILLIALRLIKQQVYILILGVMLAAFLSSGVGILEYFAEDESLKSYVVWGMGDFSSIQNLSAFEWNQNYQNPIHVGISCVIKSILL